MTESEHTAQYHGRRILVPPTAPDASRRVSICATVSDDGWWSAHDVPHEVTDVEIRADIVGDVDPAPLRNGSRRLIYALRSVAYGGRGPDAPAARAERLAAATHRYDVIDLEADRDLVPPVLESVPAHRRRICWHGSALSLDHLRASFAAMARVPARLYLLTNDVTAAEQALAPLQLLAALRRSDVTAFATGQTGIWSRLLAPWLGAPIVFGTLAGPAVGPGDRSPAGRSPAAANGWVPTVQQLISDYPFPQLPPLEAVYGIAGKAAAGSHSPRLHNTAYRLLGCAALFLPFPVTDLPAFWRTVVDSGLDALGLPLRGLTVSAPLKEAALALSAEQTTTAYVAGAANLMVRRNDGWLAGTTDGIASLAAIRDRNARLSGLTAAVIGCGGAGRAAAAELIRAGVEVTLVNRGAERGRLAAELLGSPFVPLSAFDPTGYPVLINATPVRDEVPFGRWNPTGDTIVVDFVYDERPTALASASLRHGLRVVDGWEVLHREVGYQFRLMTGQDMPPIGRARAEARASVNDKDPR